jgi:hypothetical protein
VSRGAGAADLFGMDLQRQSRLRGCGHGEPRAGPRAIAKNRRTAG